mmetsp:Transcript_49117/g.106373  ORF Transcript_49117/g.106373 Transcript_49117/m.106373 type:complete len:195 (+) Transcript_49117:253-837(+)
MFPTVRMSLTLLCVMVSAVASFTPNHLPHVPNCNVVHQRTLHRQPLFSAQPLVPASVQARTPKTGATMLGSKDGKGITDLIREYGPVAVGFHFTVWVSTIVFFYTAISVAGSGEILSQLPIDIEGGAGAGKVALTLGVVEATGPVRIALTIAATPSITARARQIPRARLAIRRGELIINKVLDSFTDRRPAEKL